MWTDIQIVAEALGVEEQGRDLLAHLKNRVVDIISKTCMLKRRPSVVCLDWLEPPMAAGHWMPEMVEIAGGSCPLAIAGSPAARLEWPVLRKANPDILVLMPCGFGLERTRLEALRLEENAGWQSLRAVRSGNVYLTDGSAYFNRPGPRLVDSMEILAAILQPALFSAPGPGRSWRKLG